MLLLISKYKILRIQHKKSANQILVYGYRTLCTCDILSFSYGNQHLRIIQVNRKLYNNLLFNSKFFLNGSNRFKGNLAALYNEWFIMVEGEKFSYLACPFCNRNMLLRKINADQLAELRTKEGIFIDPSEWRIYQVREQRGGRGSPEKGIKAKGGFYLLPEESKNIVEMLEDVELKPYAEAVIKRLKIIWNSYKEAGLL